MAKDKEVQHINAASGEIIKAKYTGSAPSVFDYAGAEYMLHNGHEYDLPGDSLHVQSLLGQQLLERQF